MALLPMSAASQDPFCRESENIAQRYFLHHKRAGLKMPAPYFGISLCIDIGHIARSSSRSRRPQAASRTGRPPARIPIPNPMPRAQRPDGCCTVVSGIAAAAIFNPDFHGVLPRFSSLPSVDKNILAWVSWFCKFFRFMAICVPSPSSPRICLASAGVATSKPAQAYVMRTALSTSCRLDSARTPWE